MTARVSIVMPCYNAEAHLAAGVGSVLNQSFTDWELIAIDDGSHDGTLQWLRTQQDERIRVIAQHNQGVSAARNNGLQQCCGEYVAFLDSDDTWAPDFLEKMVRVQDEHPEAVLAYCGWQNVGASGRRAVPFIPPEYEGPKKNEALLESCRWPIHACLTRSAVIHKIGGFDSDLRIGEDFLLWLEVASLGKIVRVPEVLAFYHHHDGLQATHDRKRAALDTLLAKQKFLNRHPEVVRQIGTKRIEKITWGKFIEQASTLYWQGDLIAARSLFRKALLAGRGTWAEMLRMFPSLLPLPFHRVISKARHPR